MHFNNFGSSVTTKSILNILFGVFIGYTFAYFSLYSEISLIRQWNFRGSKAFLDNNLKYSAVNTHEHNEDFHRLENTAVADDLSKNVRVLCWIMTTPSNHKKKAIHVKATWGKRCNILLFMSSIHDESLPSVPLPVNEGRENLWAKTKEAFKYIYRNYYEDADWFLKADDDTYVIVENLRFMLSNYSSSDPIYFGCRFKPFAKQGYMSGGAGYVLSKKALTLFIEEGLPDPKACKQGNDGAEDAEMGKCLENIGVKAMDDRDSMNRKRFFPFIAEQHLPLKPNLPAWYLNYIYYKGKPGLECCSDTAISFHYVDPNRMYFYDYFLYHLRPYGISYNYNLNIESNKNERKETVSDLENKKT